jgi:hypothetical protein
MPFVIIAVALAALGLSVREASTRHDQSEVLTYARARLLAVEDPACQDSLCSATTDSARATIVDGCTQRIIANGMRVTQPSRAAGNH